MARSSRKQAWTVGSRHLQQAVLQRLMQAEEDFATAEREASAKRGVNEKQKDSAASPKALTMLKRLRFGAAAPKVQQLTKEVDVAEDGTG